METNCFLYKCETTQQRMMKAMTHPNSFKSLDQTFFLEFFSLTKDEPIKDGLEDARKSPARVILLSILS